MSTSGGSGGGSTVTAAHIAADVPLPAGATTTVQTINVVVGTYVINAGMDIVFNNSSTSGVDMVIALGTATATIEGNFANSVGNPNGFLAGAQEHGALSALVTVTVAGTILIRAKNNDGTNAQTAAHLTDGGLAGATGYTATKTS